MAPNGPNTSKASHSRLICAVAEQSISFARQDVTPTFRQRKNSNFHERQDKSAFSCRRLHRHLRDKDFMNHYRCSWRTRLMSRSIRWMLRVSSASMAIFKVCSNRNMAS